MLQQTTVATVKPYFEAFTARWPTVEALAAADDADVMSAWAGLGYYARARNLLACARAVAGVFPETEATLRKLPGIGQYTAAAIASIAFGQRAVVVDGTIERVVSRLFAVETPLPKAKAELYALTDSVTPDTRAGDFAQALMDLGSGICTPRAPKCLICPLALSCAAKSDSYPRRLPKPVKPQRNEVAYWIEREAQVLLVRRPDNGLLGGMRALPSSLGSPAKAGVQSSGTALDDGASAFAGELLGIVTHSFTHFNLSLAVHKSSCALQPGGEWWPIDRIDDAGLPTVFAKAAKLAIRETDYVQRDAA